MPDARIHGHDILLGYPGARCGAVHFRKDEPAFTYAGFGRDEPHLNSIESNSSFPQRIQ